MPNICVAPISVAARDGGKVRRRDVGGADQREHAAGALQEPADAGELRCCPRRRAARRCRPPPRRSARPARPEPVHRRAGDEAERRVAVVEEPDHRRDAHRLRPNAPELRHHHRRRRSEAVLKEVVHRRDQPRDRHCTQAVAHADTFPGTGPGQAQRLKSKARTPDAAGAGGFGKRSISGSLAEALPGGAVRAPPPGWRSSGIPERFRLRPGIRAGSGSPCGSTRSRR